MFGQVIITVFIVCTMFSCTVLGLCAVFEYDPPEWFDKLTCIMFVGAISSGIIIMFILAFRALLRIWA